MLRYSHVMVLLAASICCMWTLVFVWQGTHPINTLAHNILTPHSQPLSINPPCLSYQTSTTNIGIFSTSSDDMNQTQCTSYLWSVCIPASFAIHLVNLKAYRLYTFLAASDNQPGKKRKTIGQDAVIIRTILLTVFTAVILAIITGVDPPQSTRVIMDPYRAKLDYYVCTSGNTSKGLFYLLVIGHIVASIVCIMPVRNGFEAFQGLFSYPSILIDTLINQPFNTLGCLFLSLARPFFSDGTVMKESFILLYMLLLIAFVMHQLGVTHPTVYLLRSALLCIGITLFCLRFLINRCVRHWISPESQEKITIVLTHIKKNIPGLASSAFQHTSNTGSDVVGSLMLKEDDDSPLFKVTGVKDDNLVEMDKVVLSTLESNTKHTSRISSLCHSHFIIPLYSLD